MVERQHRGGRACCGRDDSCRHSLQDVDVVGQPVEERAGKPLGAEGLGPFIEGQITGDQRGTALVTL